MKNFFKKLLITVLELAVLAGAVWLIAQKNGIQNVRDIVPALRQTAENIAPKPQFPEPSGQQTKTFSWEYKGVKYEMPMTLYKSTYGYYASLPKTYSYVGELPPNWEDSYYGMFLKQDASDHTIEDLAAKLKGLAGKYKLSDDQTAELVMAFVQSIPYDDARAKEILAKTGSTSMQYPYETLYRQAGVCSDKSLLAMSILRTLGYGTAIFTYEQENHMAIGIQCPKDYSTYGNGYCYAETTSVGNKIGIIPDIDTNTNKTIDAGQLATFDPNKAQQINLQSLGQVSVYQATEGKLYQGIVATKKTENKIEALKNQLAELMPQLQKQKQDINSEEAVLSGLRNDLENYKISNDFEKFNSLAKKYDKLRQAYEQDVKNYNKKVNLYNRTAQMYNTLIRQ